MISGKSPNSYVSVMTSDGFTSPSDPFVSVIVPFYNNETELVEALRALSLQTYPSDRFEVLLVDNSPKPNLSISTGLAPNVKVLHEPKPGSYSARNAAIRVARGTILAFTDSDCLPSKSWLVEGVKGVLESGYSARVAGRVVINTCQARDANLSVNEIYETIYSFPQREYCALGYSVTANLFSPREFFNSVGLFNDRLFSGGDVEWGKRASGQGIPLIYRHECIVGHPCRSTSELIRKSIRVIGGIHEKSLERSMVFNLASSVKDAPIKKSELVKAFSETSLSISQRAMGAAFRQYIRFLCSMERVKLIFGLSRARRQ